MTLWICFAVFVRQNPVNAPKKIEFHTKVRTRQIDQCFYHPNLRSEIWSINRHGKCPPLRLWIAWLDRIYWWRRARGDGRGEDHAEIDILGSTCNPQSILLGYFWVVFKEAATYFFFNGQRKIGNSPTLYGDWLKEGHNVSVVDAGKPPSRDETNCLQRLLSYCIVWSSPVEVDGLVTLMGK